MPHGLGFETERLTRETSLHHSPCSESILRSEVTSVLQVLGVHPRLGDWATALQPHTEAPRPSSAPSAPETRPGAKWHLWKLLPQEVILSKRSRDRPFSFISLLIHPETDAS